MAQTSRKTSRPLANHGENLKEPYDLAQTQNEGQKVAAFTVVGDRGAISRNETKETEQRIGALRVCADCKL